MNGASLCAEGVLDLIDDAASSSPTSPVTASVALVCARPSSIASTRSSAPWVTPTTEAKSSIPTTAGATCVPTCRASCLLLARIRHPSSWGGSTICGGIRCSPTVATRRTSRRPSAPKCSRRAPGRRKNDGRRLPTRHYRQGRQGGMREVFSWLRRARALRQAACFRDDHGDRWRGIRRRERLRQSANFMSARRSADGNQL
jgi:hypothetical protein